MADYKLENTIIHLIGFPGTGKYTIACEITKLADIRLVDNHLINNIVLSIIPTDGITPLPVRVWENMSRIWDICVGYDGICVAAALQLRSYKRVVRRPSARSAELSKNG